MNIVETFEELISDPIKTEELVHHQLKKMKFSLASSFVDLPINSCIIKYGISKTQILIDNILKRYDNLFFVTHNYTSSELDFGHATLYTPHARKDRPKERGIPHFCWQLPQRIIPFKDRKYKITFIGSERTTRDGLRQRMCKKLSKFNIHEIGSSFYRKDSLEKEELSKLYVNNVSNSKCVLCPRGHGPSSIRLWECFLFNCVPIVISDNLKMPLDKIINWSKYCIFVPENEIEEIESYIHPENELEYMTSIQTEIFDIIGNKNIYKSICLDQCKWYL